MAYLQEELDKEVALCRKEKEEFQLLREQSDTLAFEEATAAARAAAVAYAAESPLSNNLSNDYRCIIIIHINSISAMSIPNICFPILI